MPDTPLNKDALANLRLLADRATEEVRHAVIEPDILHKLLDVAEVVAQPEVNSVEELDALPVGSLIMMREIVAPFLRTDDGWESTRTPGKPVWDYISNPHFFPARVLWSPEVNDV